jgi:hypothetical protein
MTGREHAAAFERELAEAERAMHVPSGRGIRRHGVTSGARVIGKRPQPSATPKRDAMQATLKDLGQRIAKLRMLDR